MITARQHKQDEIVPHWVWTLVVADLYSTIYLIDRLLKSLVSVRYTYSYKLNISHILKALPQKQRKIYSFRPLLKTYFKKLLKK